MQKLVKEEKTSMVGYQKTKQENIFMKSAKILFTTLSMAGGEKMLREDEDTKQPLNKFDYLIVDEACQCIEPSGLIPFCLNPKRVILVGD
jgi:superfamily I DNA and/or RNA helicase